MCLLFLIDIVGFISILTREMASILRVEDQLVGASKFSAWKARVVLFLKESELWDIVEITYAIPIIIPTDSMTNDAYEKKNIKAQ